MKLSRPTTPMPAAAALAAVCGLFLLSGCGSPGPTRLEQKLFTIETNRTTTTNFAPVVTTTTNFAPVVVSSPSGVFTSTVPVVTLTTQSVPVVSGTTQSVPVVTTNELYTYSPAPSVQLAQNVASAVPVWGDVISVGIGAVFGLWGTLRSKQANKVSTALAQGVEVARKLIETQQGQLAGERFKSWLIQHQAEKGVLAQVSKLVAEVVDAPSATAVAGQLIELSCLQKPAAPSAKT